MPSPLIITSVVSLVPQFLVIAYHDVRYRRIPNPFVLAVLVSGLAVNASFAGFTGVLDSVEGCGLALGLMLMLHIFGAMGAGDVKLFAAVGSMIGIHLVLPTFVIVVLTGGLLAVVVMLRSGTARMTMWRVSHILLGILPGSRVPRYEIPSDRRQTIPYGVAITVGSLVALLFLSRMKR
jgi:prepilin peptidase CpaA